MIELDHFFVCTNINAPEIDRVLNCGLIEGRSNIHPGQGTANRCIFFHNAMLEFLWVADDREVRTPLIAPTQMSFLKSVVIDVPIYRLGSDLNRTKLKLDRMWDNI